MQVSRTEVIERIARPTSVLPAVAEEPVERPRRWIAWAILGLILAVLIAGLVVLTVNLLSSGSNLTTVPQSILGKTVPVAQEILSQAGFQSKVDSRRVFSSTYPKDTVADYTPKEAAGGATITLVVSKGPTIRRVLVPDVSCQPVNQATDQLRTAGFLVVVSGVADNANCTSAGVVAKTDPPAGARIKEGSTVRIFTLSQPSPSPTTPSPTTPSPPPTTPPPTSPSPSPTTPPPTSPSPSAPPPSPSVEPPGAPAGPGIGLHTPGTMPGRQ
jgi:beta-lactam-binding protein with PASTA domain